jgi:hypothetical protein
VPVESSKWDVKSLSKHSNKALKTMVKIAIQLYAPTDKQQAGLQVFSRISNQQIS